MAAVAVDVVAVDAVAVAVDAVAVDAVVVAVDAVAVEFAMLIRLVSVALRIPD